MMLLSSLIFALVSPTLTSALPTPSSAYAFDPTTALSYRHADGIARLASAVNDAHCPDRADRDIVDRSDPAADDELDVGWIISHDRSRHTYMLAFKSPSAEDTLELLATGAPVDLTTLPSTFFGSDEVQGEGPMSLYTPYVPLLPIAEQAVEALRSTIKEDRPSLLSRLLALLILSRRSDTPRARVEMAGHGLGSVTALLASLHLSSRDPSLSIETTLFSLPRVGDQRFANTVDHFLADRSQSAGSLSIRRVSSGRDPMPDLPPPHFGLHHPLSIQHLTLGADAGMSRSRVEDSHGPYAGVMIGLESRC